MKEIKFRAWDKERKEIINFEQKNIDYYTLRFHECGGEGHYSIEFDNSEDETKYLEQKRFILMQFTGLLDKDGKEIYEEDILATKEKDVIFEVIYGWNGDNNIFGWNYKSLRKPYRIYSMDTPKRLKVIGNIYENPELLKVN